MSPTPGFVEPSPLSSVANLWSAILASFGRAFSVLPCVSAPGGTDRSLGTAHSLHDLSAPAVRRLAESGDLNTKHDISIQIAHTMIKINLPGAGVNGTRVSAPLAHLTPGYNRDGRPCFTVVHHTGAVAAHAGEFSSVRGEPDAVGVVEVPMRRVCKLERL